MIFRTSQLLNTRSDKTSTMAIKATCQVMLMLLFMASSFLFFFPFDAAMATTGTGDKINSLDSHIVITDVDIDGQQISDETRLSLGHSYVLDVTLQNTDRPSAKDEELRVKVTLDGKTLTSSSFTLFGQEEETISLRLYVPEIAYGQHRLSVSVTKGRAQLLTRQQSSFDVLVSAATNTSVSSLKLFPGWNLVSFAGEPLSFTSQTCAAHSKLLGFVYYAPMKTYVSLYELETILARDTTMSLSSYLASHAVWLYAFNECTLDVETQLFTDSVAYEQGWQLLPSIYAQHLQQEKPYCIDQVYSWDLDGQAWTDAHDVAAAQAVKFAASCRIDTSYLGGEI